MKKIFSIFILSLLFLISGVFAVDISICLGANVQNDTYYVIKSNFLSVSSPYFYL